ncbi:MAG: DUF4041 domain-containing protein [Clostridiales bacterium]|nr:DUF4041 domain-containing protein [Clostridiales bacterium]
MIQSKAVKAYSADLERLARYQTITDAKTEAANIRDVAKQDADQMKSVAYAEATHAKEDAQQSAAQTKNAAEAEAAQIVAEAQRKAEEIAGDAKRAIAEAEARASEFSEVQSKLATAKSQLVEVEEEVLMQSFGLYKPQFSFATSAEYKVRLNDLRAKEKAMLKDGTAATGSSTWTVNGSEAEGKKMVRNMQKLLLRAFNGECDVLVEKVKFNNLEATEKRMVASRDAISKLGTIMKVSITPAYFSLKVQELHLAYEYQVKKQEEKEAAKEARQKQREEAKAAKELENARKKLEKEQNHYSNALSRLDAQIQNATDEKELADLKQKKAEMETQLATIDQEMKDVDYRSANQKAGYVYIISNIGAFGENVYKIGMTRRLDPMDRVDELGDASVPFNFDVHAMIFTDDAPGLEAALHNAFADRKVNFVNQRREFFNVTLDEIKKVVRENYDKTVEFVDVPPAEQYRESLLMRQQQTA